MNKGDIGRTYCSHKYNEKCVQSFGWNTWREDTSWK